MALSSATVYKAVVNGVEVVRVIYDQDVTDIEDTVKELGGKKAKTQQQKERKKMRDLYNY